MLEPRDALHKDMEQHANRTDCTIGWIRLGDDGMNSYMAEFLLRMSAGTTMERSEQVH